MKTALPTIGIRPTIDGRRLGVRESLEDQTMNMAKAAAALIEANIRHASGEPVKCVIADTCIGGPAEAAACADKFKANNVGVSLAVTPCWCYGSETFDMDPFTPKAIWGFNGTERPGAVYLAAALAGLNQKGFPAFSIYGKDVQDAGDTSIPEDVAEKILRFCRAGLAVATLRGKGYLSIGGCSMGIAGSIVDQSFWENYLGIRVQAVDMTEVRRRMDQKIYDEAEFDLAMQWADAVFKFAEDKNRPDLKLDEAGRRRTFKESVLMAMIFRDMMQGNPKLKKIDREEESLGYQAIAGGFQGQRHWTDFYPNGDIAETLLNSTFDWNGPRAPLPFATENDSLNGACLLFGYLLTGQANVFADVRTYWSPEAVESASRVIRWKPCQGRHHPPHQFRLRRPGRLHGLHRQGRTARHEKTLGRHSGRCENHDGTSRLVPGQPGILPRRRLLRPLRHQGRRSRHHDAPESSGTRPRPHRGGRLVC